MQAIVILGNLLTEIQSMVKTCYSVVKQENNKGLYIFSEAE